jgi:hypothetical protein
MILRRTFVVFTSVLLIPPTVVAWSWLALFGRNDLSSKAAGAAPALNLLVYYNLIPGLVAVTTLIAASVAILAQLRGRRGARIIAKVFLLFALAAFPIYAGTLALLYEW